MPSALAPGTVLIQTDTGNMYVDDTGSSRVQITDTRKQDDLGLSKTLSGTTLRISPSNSTHVLELYSNNNKIIYNSSIHDFNNGTLKNVANPADGTDAVNKNYVDIAFRELETEIVNTAAASLPLKGGTMTGNIDLNGNLLLNIGTPNADTDAATKGYVDTKVDSAIQASDAMIFKGTIGTGGTVTQLPTSGYKTGWTYRVVTAGTYAGKVCEVGDMIIALNDGPSTGSSVINADWVDVQGNIDGAVIAPANLTANQVIIGNNGTDTVKTLAAGSNGQVLKMVSGVPAWSTDNDTTYSAFTGATSSAAGSAGLVPAPAIANRTQYLRGDGTWAAPPQGVSSLLDLGVTATATELNYMDGVTSNVQTQLNAKQAKITGGASSIVSSNLTASRVLISNTSGKVANSTVTSTELGYLDGVTSSIQTQLNSKQATITGGASTIASANLTASRALISTSSGKVAVSAVTATELSYLDGVTSNIQTQLNGKLNSNAGTLVPNEPGNNYVLTTGSNATAAWARTVSLTSGTITSLKTTNLTVNTLDYTMTTTEYNGLISRLNALL